jgi:hypothetical protein
VRGLTAINRAHEHALLIRWSVPGEKYEVAPIGQKLRPAMAPQAWYVLRHGDWRPTRRRHARYHSTVDVRGKYQDVVAVPRATAATRRGCQFLRAGASQIDLLQLAVGEKANRAAIR